MRSPVSVAVVVPTLGRNDALARCLDALLEGTDAPAEIVVVDQSGMNDIAELVDTRRAAFGGLRHVRAERRGLSAARNAGAREAGGEVIAFTDDDCVPDRGWIAGIVGALEQDPGLAAVTGPMLPLGPPADGLVAVSSRTSMERRTFRRGALPWNVGTGGNTTIRRDWLERLGGYDERLGVGTRGKAGEDIDLYRRLLGAGGTVVYEPAAVCRHELKSVADRRSRRGSYGVGAGAALGRWLRDGDARAVVATARWLSLRSRLALTAAGARRAAAVDELRVVGGTARGLAYGVRLPARGRQT